MHLCNAFFEWELQSPIERSLADWMNCHPMIRKLQYLPLEYGSSQEFVLVSHLSENPDPRLRLFSDPPAGRLETWGASLAVSRWAQKHQISYSMPPWEVVKEVNSKIFSFSHSPKLPHAALLKSEADLTDWIQQTPGPLVLKTPQGVAGKGHFFVKGKGGEEIFLNKHPILIGEPWVERTFDFSTQWKIETDSIVYLGATILKNKPNGAYLSNLVWGNKNPYQWALDRHLEIAKPILKKIKMMGFFGNLGIDAFVYLCGGKETLHPIGEINARKTMGYVLLHKNSI